MGEGSLWFEVIKQTAAFDLITDDDEKDVAGIQFLNLSKILEAKQVVHDK